MTGIALTQKSCIFTQKSPEKCIFKIVMRPRTKQATWNTYCISLDRSVRFCCLRNEENFKNGSKRSENRGCHIGFSRVGDWWQLNIRNTCISIRHFELSSCSKKHVLCIQVIMATLWKDCLKAGKKNTFTIGCQNFQRSALVRHMQQVDHKATSFLFGGLSR